MKVPIIRAVAIWPVTGQLFKAPAVLYSQQIGKIKSEKSNRKNPIFSVNRKNPANLNYHMPIKKSQAILKCFIDLKFSV